MSFSETRKCNLIVYWLQYLKMNFQSLLSRQQTQYIIFKKNDMKRKKILYSISLMVIGVFFNFCEKDSETEKMELNVSTEKLNFTGEEASQTIDIISNIEWTATSNVEWCTISPAIGNGNATITITLQNNNTTSERKGVITVKDSKNSLSKFIEVTQDVEILNVAKLFGIWHVTNITDESGNIDYGENAEGNMKHTTIELTINTNGTYTQINKSSINDGSLLPQTTGSYLFTPSNRTLKVQGTTVVGPFNFPDIHLYVIEKLTDTELIYSEDTGLSGIGLEKWTFVKVR